jgi:hypothetical protein
MKDPTIRLKLAGLEAQLKLVKQYIVDSKEPELARRVLQTAAMEAETLANSYPDNEPLQSIAYLIRSVVDGPEIDIVNMVNGLLKKIILIT